MPPAPAPLPPELHRLLTLLPRLSSPRHLLQAHAHLLPRGGHRHTRLVSALLLASLRLPIPDHAVPLLRRVHPSVSLRAAARLPRVVGALRLVPQLHSLLLRGGHAADPHTAASLIKAYCSRGGIASARRVFDETAASGADVVSWNVMIDGYVKCGDLARARELFDVMPERNVVSWTMVIGAYAQMRRPEEAIGVFRRMQVEGIEPDGVALLSVLSACGDLGVVDLGEWVHRFVLRRRLYQEVPLMNAIIDMYVKCGSVQKAVEVFEGMEQKSVVTWTTMIAGFALHGLGLEAVGLFRQMEKENVSPNNVTFLAVLSACCLMEARGLLQDMPFKANAAIWGALLAAARTHGDTELGEQSLLHLIELEPHNSGNYILLSNIYAEQERWDAVRELRISMRDRGLRNVPGASSIEVDGMVHEFTSRDGSHPSLHMICEFLCAINSNIKSAGHIVVLPENLHDVEEV
uniref:Pentacotripeptide-repeat region of PRORP domain-containing protein n=1 Tax=Leersia perrieri TaxID=77586 RepID=A0A0D9UZ93_9ORYZ